MVERYCSHRPPSRRHAMPQPSRLVTPVSWKRGRSTWVTRPCRESSTAAAPTGRPTYATCRHIGRTCGALAARWSGPGGFALLDLDVGHPGGQHDVRGLLIGEAVLHPGEHVGGRRRDHTGVGLARVDPPGLVLADGAELIDHEGAGRHRDLLVVAAVDHEERRVSRLVEQAGV